MNPYYHYQTLKDINVPTITDCFNLAFSTYPVPVNRTEKQMRDKFESEGIDLSLSVGAFHEGNLVAFILHGAGKLNGISTIYNGGTGVVPEIRGQQLTTQLYQFILPILIRRNYKQTMLEVLTTNRSAIKIYSSLGFEIVRTFDCYKGRISINQDEKARKVTELNEYHWNHLESFWNWRPSWQHNQSAVSKSGNQLNGFQIEHEGKTVGYAIFHPEGRIYQFAVSPESRRQGIGSQLFCAIQSYVLNDLTVVNVESTNVASTKFLESLGLHRTLQQHEMLMTL